MTEQGDKVYRVETSVHQGLGLRFGSEEGGKVILLIGYRGL